MTERLTTQASALIALAEAEARQLGYEYLGTQLILLVLPDAQFQINPCDAATALNHAGHMELSRIRELALSLDPPPSPEDSAQDEQLPTAGFVRYSDVPTRMGTYTLFSSPPQTAATVRSRTGPLPQTPRFKHALELAAAEAERMGDEQVSSGHILLAMFQDPDSVAYTVLCDPENGLGLDLEQMRQIVQRIKREC